MHNIIAHARHADLVALVEDYLEDTNKSARWLGLTVAQDARLVPNLRRGQSYPTAVLLALTKRLRAFYEAEVAKLDAGEAPVLRLAA